MDILFIVIVVELQLVGRREVIGIVFVDALWDSPTSFVR
jgi:hypothetical protein